ncbi:hypothetical protein AB0E10_12500 [Streptomyces sp. NPDC048045]|uniref:hypothetical protein n=1 Tax=Streptomyces sp. NPDC048045 TaxID=3154710 RepID=UPI00341A59DC
MPPASVHFNGGVALPDAATVMRALAEGVPVGVRRLPDGETGGRAQWIGYQYPRLLATPGLTPVPVDPDAVDPYAGGPSVRLADGVDPRTIRWPALGYAEEYEKSYATFLELREEGVVPAGVRMQAEYPTPMAVANLFHPDDRDRITPSYGRALLGDLDLLLAHVPHDDLAVQWDLAVETVVIDQDPSLLEPVTSRVAALMEHLPADVPVGLHLCYGDFEHRHMVEPDSLANQVDIANALGEGPGRRPAWISFTVPQDRREEAYFAPLAGLRTGPETELYLSVVPYHPDKQAPGTVEAQTELIDQFLPGDGRPWGICTECGMARAEREDVPRLIDLHREILRRFADLG